MRALIGEKALHVRCGASNAERWGVFIMTSIEILFVSLQAFTAVLVVALLVANAQRGTRAREFEERAATREELTKIANQLTAKVAELEARVAGKDDLSAATVDLPRRDDLASALDPLPRTEDIRKVTEPLAHKTDLRDAVADLARKSDLQDVMKPYPTSADFNALMDSVLARQTSEVAHRLDTLAEEIAATHGGGGTSMALPPEIGGSITEKSVDAAIALFDASEDLVTAVAVPLAELPRDGGRSIVQHQQRCQAYIEKVLSARRTVHMLFPEGNPVRTSADAVCAAAEQMRDELRANYETMNRAALNGANPGTTSAQRLAFRQAEQRAVDAQSQYSEALTPVRETLNRAFDAYSTALNTQIHGTRNVSV